MYTLEQFFKSGNLGEIKLYSTLVEVEAILGKTDFIFEIQTNMFTLKYDYLQLTFQENTVRRINVLVPDPSYNKKSPSCLDTILSEPWKFTTETKLEELIELLYSYNPIPFWEIDNKSSIGTTLCLAIENKVKVYFDLERFEFAEILVEGDIY